MWKEIFPFIDSVPQRSDYCAVLFQMISMSHKDTAVGDQTDDQKHITCPITKVVNWGRGSIKCLPSMYEVPDSVPSTSNWV